MQILLITQVFYPDTVSVSQHLWDLANHLHMNGHNVIVYSSKYPHENKDVEYIPFEEKYGFKCPVGVRGRNSDNLLYKQKIEWEVSQSLREGMIKTYKWINEQVNS